MDYFAYLFADRIDVRRIQWSADWRFSLVQPDLMHVRALSWDSAATTEDSTATLRVVAANPLAGVAHLEALRVRDDGSQVPVSLDSLGLPGTLALTSDTTLVSWKVKWVPDPSDTSHVMHLLVRLADQTAIAQPLTVVRRPELEVTGMAWDAASTAAGDTATLAIAAHGWEYRSVPLEALRLRADGTKQPLALDSLGLPETITLTGDTTRVRWTARWQADTPDTSQVLRLEVRLADSSATAAPLAVTGPPPAHVTAMSWEGESVAEGDTATLSIAALDWAGHVVRLEVLRARSDDSRVPLELDSLGLPGTVALTGDTTRVRWKAKWLADTPDTSRLLRLEVRLADSSALAAPLSVIGPPRPLRITEMAWSAASVAVGDTATLSIAAYNWSGHGVSLEALRLRSAGSRVPLALGALGLPGAVALTGDTTRVRWSARWLADTPDTSQVLRLEVRSADSSATAGRLDVVGSPRPLAVTELAWDRASVAEGDTATLRIAAYNWVGRAVSLAAFRGHGDGTRVPLEPDSLGLPGTVALTGDTTRVRWKAKWLVDTPDTSRFLRLELRLADSSATAAPLVVVGPARALRVTELAWDRAGVAEGDTATLTIAAYNWVEGEVVLEARRVRGDSLWVPVPLDSLGLPETIALTGDTTRVRWAARWQADTPDTSQVLRLVVRLADSSATAALLLVTGPPPLEVAGVAWDRASVADGDTATLSIVALGWMRRSVSLEALRVRDEGPQVLLALSALGLPARVPLTGDTTRVAWRARWLADTPDSSRALDLLVRLQGRSPAAPLLTVLVPPIPPDSLLGAPGGAPSALALEGAFPSPTRGALTVAFSLPGSGPATLELMDVAGRRVSTRDVGGLGPGRHVVLLDDGRTLAGGIYFIRLRSGGRQIVARAVVLR